MSEKESVLDDYSRVPVPTEKTVGALHVAVVLIGGTIAVPIFLLSAELSSSRGFYGALPTFFIGALILGIFASLTSTVGARVRLSTYMLVQYSFGHQGAALVSLAVALSLFGWFAILASIFAQTVQQVVSDVFGTTHPVEIYIALGSALFVGVTIYGFKALDKLAVVLVPCMLGLLAYTCYISLQKEGAYALLANQAQEISFGHGVSAVVGTYIVGVITMPDFTRYANSVRHAVIAAAIGLCVSFPIVMIMAAVPSVVSGEQDLIKLMVALGIGVPALLMLIFSTWSSNVLVLYSGSLSAAIIFKSLTFWKIVLAFGLIGMSLAMLGIMDYYVPFLVVLGIAIPPVGAIYVIHYLLNRRQLENIYLSKTSKIELDSILAWVSGFMAGLLSSYSNVSLFSTPSLDAIFVTSLVYLGMTTLLKRKSQKC